MTVYYDTGTQWVDLSLKGESNEPIDPATGMFVGMYNLPEGEANWLATEQEWGGVKSGIARSYSPGMRSSAPPIVERDFGKRATWHSLKSSWVGMANGNDDAAVTSFLNSIPSDHDLLLTYAHEPENDNPLNQEDARSAEWRAAQAHFYDLVKSVRPQTWVGPVLMDWTFNPASGRVWQRWTPAADKMDFFGLDPYQPYKFPIIGAPNTWHNWPMSPAITAWQVACDDLGVPGAIGEIACHEDETGIGPSRKAQWIQDAVSYGIQHGHLAFCYFNAYKPGDTAEAMLLNSHQTTLDAWAGILSANQRGVKS